MASTALMAFAITVTIFKGDADTIRIAHNRILTPASCTAWQNLSKKEKPLAVDPTTGRQILSRSYECVPIELEDMKDKLSRAGTPLP